MPLRANTAAIRPPSAGPIRRARLLVNEFSFRLWHIALRVTKWCKPEGERNQKDQHTNTAVDQAHVPGLRNCQAAKQRTQRACWPGQYSREGDEAPKQRVGNDQLGHTVGADQKKDVCTAAEGPDDEDRWI